VFDLPHITLDEQQTFYEGIQILKDAEKDVYILGGNHENLDKTLTTFDKIPHIGFTYIKKGKLFSSTYCDVHCAEHLSIHQATDIALDTKKTNILLSHFRCDLGMIKEEVNVQYISEKFDYVIASDIHYHHKPFDNVYYTSSPYGLHYSPKTTYGFLEITVEKAKVEVKTVLLDLPSKYKIIATPNTAGNVMKYATKHDDYISIQVTGTPQELEDLPELTSKNITYNKKVSEIDDDVMIGMVNELADSGKFDVFDTIKKLVRANVMGQGGEYLLTVGEEQIDEIRKEIG